MTGIPDRPGPPAHPSDLALDGGGPAIEAHLSGCAPCRWRVEAGRLAVERFEKDVLPRTLPRMRQRLQRRRWAWRGFWIGAPALAAGVVVLALQSPSKPTGGVEPGWTGVKGRAAAPALEIYVKRGDRVTRLEPGQRLRPGDALRWIVRGDRERYLSVESRDADGRVTRLFPGRTDAEAARVRPGDELPGSAVLDETPGSETLTAVFADKPFAIDGPPPPGAVILRVEIPKDATAGGPSR